MVFKTKKTFLKKYDKLSNFGIDEKFRRRQMVIRQNNRFLCRCRFIAMSLSEQSSHFE